MKKVIAAAVLLALPMVSFAQVDSSDVDTSALEQLLESVSQEQLELMKPMSLEVQLGGFQMKGYIPGADPNLGKPVQPVEWVTIDGTDANPLAHWKACGEGKGFCMGTTNGNGDELPIREVTIKTFEMSKTAVTVEQYAECMIKGECTKPDTGRYCNWGKTGRERHPVNCVNWGQANQYAKFKNARLPSESEWEYAATSGGKNQKYPWGNEDATCERAVMYGNGGYGCGNKSTMDVCSKPAGNTAQGLCDMAGNVWEWVQDKYQDSYAQTPTDGKAFEGAGSYRVVRGGSFRDRDAARLRADNRSLDDPGSSGLIGFRLAR